MNSFVIPEVSTPKPVRISRRVRVHISVDAAGVLVMPIPNNIRARHLTRKEVRVLAAVYRAALEEVTERSGARVPVGCTLRLPIRFFEQTYTVALQFVFEGGTLIG